MFPACYRNIWKFTHSCEIMQIILRENFCGVGIRSANCETIRVSLLNRSARGATRYVARSMLRSKG